VNLLMDHFRKQNNNKPFNIYIYFFFKKKKSQKTLTMYVAKLCLLISSNQGKTEQASVGLFPTKRRKNKNATNIYNILLAWLGDALSQTSQTKQKKTQFVGRLRL